MAAVTLAKKTPGRFRCFLSAYLRNSTMASKSNLSVTAEKPNSDELKLADNPYYGKYAAKIAALQNASPNVFTERIDSLAKEKQPSKSGDTTSSGFTAPSSKAKTESVGSYTYSKVKELSSVMKTELLADKSSDDISRIWHEYFHNKDVVSAVLTADMFRSLHQKVLEHPTFIFPLPRDQGYEFMVCQFAGNEAHFTSLINYQTYKENAPECLIVVYYPDLADTKNIVLVKGDYNKDLLASREAQCLINQLQLYYAHPTDSKLELLEKFTKSPDNFQHMDLIKEFESITM